ncbi:MAG: HAD family phosphatase [Dehalococcoidia bacterium]
MAITTVIFDLGGVVCGFRPERRLAALAAACDLPPEAIQQCIWGSGFDADCDRGRFTATEVYEQARQMLGLRMPYAGFRAAWVAAFEPDVDVLALVDRLRPRLRTALLTDNGPVLRDALPALLPEVAHRFDPLLFSCDLGALKPSREAFATALDRLETPAERTLLIDDAPANVEGARACGMAAFRFTSVADLASALRRLL